MATKTTTKREIKREMKPSEMREYLAGVKAGEKNYHEDYLRHQRNFTSKEWKDCSAYYTQTEIVHQFVTIVKVSYDCTYTHTAYSAGFIAGFDIAEEMANTATITVTEYIAGYEQGKADVQKGYKTYAYKNHSVIVANSSDYVDSTVAYSAGYMAGAEITEELIITHKPYDTEHCICNDCVTAAAKAIYRASQPVTTEERSEWLNSKIEENSDCPGGCGDTRLTCSCDSCDNCGNATWQCECSPTELKNEEGFNLHQVLFSTQETIATYDSMMSHLADVAQRVDGEEKERIENKRQKLFGMICELKEAADKINKAIAIGEGRSEAVKQPIKQDSQPATTEANESDSDAIIIENGAGIDIYIVSSVIDEFVDNLKAEHAEFRKKGVAFEARHRANIITQLYRASAHLNAAIQMSTSDANEAEKILDSVDCHNIGF